MTLYYWTGRVTLKCGALFNVKAAEALNLTSEASKWLVYNSNHRFTIYSHTHHGGHIFHQILCGQMSKEAEGRMRIRQKRIKRHLNLE